MNIAKKLGHCHHSCRRNRYPFKILSPRNRLEDLLLVAHDIAYSYQNQTLLFGLLIIYFVLQFSSQLNVLHICYFQFVYYPYFYFTQYVAVNSIYQRWARDNCLALRQRQNVTELQRQQKNPNNFKDLMSLWRQRYVCRHITIINNVLA